MTAKERHEMEFRTNFVKNQAKAIAICTVNQLFLKIFAPAIDIITQENINLMEYGNQNDEHQVQSAESIRKKKVNPDSYAAERLQELILRLQIVCPGITFPESACDKFNTDQILNMFKLFDLPTLGIPDLFLALVEGNGCPELANEILQIKIVRDAFNKASFSAKSSALKIDDLWECFQTWCHVYRSQTYKNI